MTYKTLFMKDKELASQLAAVTHGEWFLKCLAYVKAEMMDTPGIMTEHLLGARKFEQILLTLADGEEEFQMHVLTSGLRHDLDTKRKDQVPKESK